MLNKIGKPVDPDEWHMTPQTVNAYYNPLQNEICFPAGILQPPFFFMNADDAVNYGAIGVVIGHEMTHGFDDQGRKFDKEGNLSEWWTESDAKRFDERTKVLVDQYNAFIVLDSTHADGELTLGENIADLGGLNISYDAFKMTDPGDKEINGFTPDQRFFLAYAHVWGQNIRDKEISRRTKEDVHSLGKFRVNGPLPHLEAFHFAFGINEGDPMYLPLEKRAVIW
jgi:putative endopeptidase